MSSAGISAGNFRNSVVARIGRTPGQAVTELQTSTNMALASAAADSFPRTGTRRVLTPSGTGGFANTQTGIMRVTSAATHALLEELLRLAEFPISAIGTRRQYDGRSVLEETRPLSTRTSVSKDNV